ncbi:hypothetical protein N7534_002814 [Penicillium rubens]|nr:hypothetical protein N7534_002814 [Penicillium rubens]
MPARISGYDNNHLYWSVRNGNNGFITLDTRKATKFGINRDDSESLHQHRKMIVLGSHNIGVMGLNATSFRFSLGSFYNGDFGDAWDEKLKYTAEPTLAYKLEYAGEEWELVH